MRTHSVALLIVLLTSSLVVFSQKEREYTEGYVLMEKGDTLRGKIRDNVETEDDPNKQRIWYVDKAGKTQRISAKKALEYRKNGFPPYRRIRTVRGHMKFARVMAEGAVILYKYFNVKSTGGVRNYGGGMAFDVPADIDVEYYLQRAGKPELVLVPNFNFKSKMAKYFADDPDLKSRIESETVVRVNLPEAIQDYNEKRNKK